MGTVISAIITAIAGITTTALANKAQKATGQESRELAFIQRGDTLAQQSANNILSRQQLRQNQQQFQQGLGFQKQEAALGRAERGEERAYGRYKDQISMLKSVLSNDIALRDRLVALRRGRKS